MLSALPTPCSQLMSQLTLGALRTLALSPSAASSVGVGRAYTTVPLSVLQPAHPFRSSNVPVLLFWALSTAASSAWMVFYPLICTS